jgi:transcriptional regulator
VSDVPAGLAPRDYLDAMLAAIVGFALPIARLEGKWKMSQNRPPEDRTGDDEIADVVEKPK